MFQVPLQRISKLLDIREDIKNQIQKIKKSNNIMSYMQTNDNIWLTVTKANQEEQQPDCWFTGCPRIWTVGGLDPPAGWLAILQDKTGLKLVNNCNQCMSLAMSLPCLDCSSHGHESFFDIGSILGTCFQEWDSKFICESLCWQNKQFNKSLRQQCKRT